MRLPRILSTATVTALAVLLLAGTTGCGNKAGSATVVVLGLNDNGKTIDVDTGATIEVRLAANPTTGYQWQTKDLDTSVLEQVSANYQPPQQQMPGAGGTQVFRFKTLKVAETTLTLVYVRSWETGVAPAQTWAVKVNVAKGSSVPDTGTDGVERKIEESKSGESKTGSTEPAGETTPTTKSGTTTPTSKTGE